MMTGGTEEKNELLLEVQKALENKGCQVFLTGRPEEIEDYLERLAAGKTAVITAFDLAARLNLQERLRERGVEILNVAEKDDVLPAGVGITGADVVVVETGTIFLVEDDGDVRLASNMPGIHVAVAGIDAVVPTLADGLQRVRDISRQKYNRPLANYVTAVSGPSRTADIEFKMAFGMHGPKEVHVLFLLDELGPAGKG